MSKLSFIKEGGYVAKADIRAYLDTNHKELDQEELDGMTRTQLSDLASELHTMKLSDCPGEEKGWPRQMHDKGQFPYDMYDRMHNYEKKEDRYNQGRLHDMTRASYGAHGGGPHSGGGVKAPGTYGGGSHGSYDSRHERMTKRFNDNEDEEDEEEEVVGSDLSGFRIYAGFAGDDELASEPYAQKTAAYRRLFFDDSDAEEEEDLESYATRKKRGKSPSKGTKKTSKGKKKTSKGKGTKGKKKTSKGKKSDEESSTGKKAKKTSTGKGKGKKQTKGKRKK